MLALTLKHPWPWAICRLGKDIENRTWRPPDRMVREYFAIHGGVSPDGGKGRFEVTQALHSLQNRGLARHSLIAGDVILPGLVAVVRLVGVVTESDSPWFEGPVGWQLDELFVLPGPIACKGAQGLWAIPEDHVAEIRRQWGMAKTLGE